MHLLNFVIVQALAYLEPEALSKSCETLTRHIQNPAIVRTVYSGIILPYSDIFRTWRNACICKNLTYLESWYIQNPYIIASQRIIRILSYFRKYVNPIKPWKFRTLAWRQSWNIQNPGIFKTWDVFGTSQRLNIECFVKTVKSYNYFSKVLYLRSLTHLSLKYSLTCTVISHNVLYETYSEPVYYCKFRHGHIHVLFRYIQPCFGKFKILCNTIQNPAIVRFLAPLELEIYSELCQSMFWHIQNAV